MNVVEILRARADLCPEAPALLDTCRSRPRRLTFADLEQTSCRGAALLRRAGLQPGEGVLILQPMSAELYSVLAAVFRLGLVAMFLDPSAGWEHIARCCALYPPAALIASARAHLLCLVSPALRRIPRKFVIGAARPGAVSWAHSETLPPWESVEPCSTETPALLTFTSGSAGTPKAALRTHGFLQAQHRALEQMTAPPPGEIDLAALPIVVLSNLASGVASLLPDADLRHPGAIRTAPVFAQIAAHRPTRLTASPAFLERLAEDALAQGRTFPTLRSIFTGGGPVFPRLLDQLRGVAPQARIVAVYGSTEAEPIATSAWEVTGEPQPSAPCPDSGLCAGRPVPSLDLRILPDRWGQPIGPFTAAAFEADCLPPGAIGEIVVSGGHVLPGYLHGQGDTETRFRADGALWLRTGDAGFLDTQGQLWLQGRCDSRITDASGVLYPLAVEAAAQRQPGVRRAAVLSHRGQRVLAVTPSGHPASPDVAALQQALAWAGIEAVQVCRDLPMDPRHNAKIDYPALRRRLK